MGRIQPEYRVRFFNTNPNTVRRFYAWDEEEARKIITRQTTERTRRSVIEFRHAAGYWTVLWESCSI